MRSPRSERRFHRSRRSTLTRSSARPLGIFCASHNTSMRSDFVIAASSPAVLEQRFSHRHATEQRATVTLAASSRATPDASGARDNDQPARCSPKTLRSTSAISPSVARALTAPGSAAAGCPCPRAACASAASAARGSPASRCSREARQTSRPAPPRAPGRGGAAAGGARARASSANWFDADDDALAALDRALVLVGAPLDLALREARSIAATMPPQLVDLGDVAPRARASISLGQRLDRVGAAERIDDVGDAASRAPRICCVRSASARRRLGRQRQRLVVAVGVQRLRAAQHRGQRLHRRAHDVVQRLLRRQRRARGLRVEAQHQRLRVLRAEAVAHDARPQPPRGAELGDLLEEVVVRVEEEREPRRERRRRRARAARAAST